MQEYRQQINLRYQEINPEEIIYKLKAMIKIMGEQNGRYELATTFNNRN